MAAQVGTRDAVAGLAQDRSEITVSITQVTHARYEHHQRAIASYVIADAPVAAVEVGGVLD